MRVTGKLLFFSCWSTITLTLCEAEIYVTVNFQGYGNLKTEIEGHKISQKLLIIQITGTRHKLYNWLHTTHFIRNTFLCCV